MGELKVGTRITRNNEAPGAYYIAPSPLTFAVAGQVRDTDGDYWASRKPDGEDAICIGKPGVHFTVVTEEDGGHRLRYFYFDEAQRPVITNTAAHLYPGDREGYTEAVSQANKQAAYGIDYAAVDSFTPDQWAALNPEKAAIAA